MDWRKRTVEEWLKQAEENLKNPKKFSEEEELFNDADAGYFEDEGDDD